MLFFEWIGPVIEVLGYIIIITGFITQYISLEVFLVLMGVSIGFGMLLSATALLLEEISFHVYQKPIELLRLFMAVILENLGYRQLTSVWRFIGVMQWLLGRKAQWGEMSRSADWQKTE